MSAHQDPGRPLSRKEALALFRELGMPVAPNTLRDWINDGTLPAFRPGRRKHVRIKAEDVRMVAERRAAR